MTDFIKMQGIFENGYGFIAKKVMKDKRLHIYSKAIYSYICSYSGKGNDAFPSQKLICSDLGISKDSLSKYLKPLKELGYITTKQENNNGKFSNTVYTINIVPCMTSSYTVATDADDSVYGETDTNNNSILNNNNINNNNSNNTVVDDSLTDEQIKFREQLAINKAKIQALINKHNFKTTPEDLLKYSAGDCELIIKQFEYFAEKGLRYLISSIKGKYDAPVKKEEVVNAKEEFFKNYSNKVSVLNIAYNNNKFIGEQKEWAEEILRKEGRL